MHALSEKNEYMYWSQACIGRTSLHVRFCLYIQPTKERLVELGAYCFKDDYYYLHL